MGPSGICIICLILSLLTSIHILSLLTRKFLLLLLPNYILMSTHGTIRNVPKLNKSLHMGC
ncbi:transmembrane protein, putative [Medicago truncatula]|uniref:Transmembrane protein, putative n=1 Tax=Medicago truncatula TaxID=3880 RepID=G7JXT0_MEDTR|nr:transmembrane protein, putative [Medicago truncatula]